MIEYDLVELEGLVMTDDLLWTFIFGHEGYVIK